MEKLILLDLFIKTFGSLTGAWMASGLGAMSISLVITLFVIPRILAFTHRRNMMDRPCSRKVHTDPVPRLGGLAFLPAVIVAIALIAALNIFMGGESATALSIIADRATALEMLMGLSATTLMYVIGLADDISGVRYSTKFVVQFLAAVMIALAGVSVTDLHGFMGIYQLPMALSLTLTVLVSMLIINAINFIDGIDGLASATSILALSIFAIIFFNHANYLWFIVALALIGTLMPFFLYNMYGKRSAGNKIFMGDTGALTLGVILAFMAIKVSTIPSTLTPTSPLVLAFTPLMLPCLDVVRLFFLRLRRGRSPFLPDRCHIHHRLLALGMSQAKATLTLVLSMAALMLINMILSADMRCEAVLALDLLVWAVANRFIYRRIVVRRLNHLKIKN